MQLESSQACSYEAHAYWKRRYACLIILIFLRILRIHTEFNKHTKIQINKSIKEY